MQTKQFLKAREETFLENGDVRVGRAFGLLAIAANSGDEFRLSVEQMSFIDNEVTDWLNDEADVSNKSKYIYPLIAAINSFRG